MKQLGRLLRAGRSGWRRVRSALILTWYRMSYPGLKVGQGVRLGRAVYLNVLTGATLELGDDVYIDSFSSITVAGRLTIGAHSYVGVGSVLVAQEHVSIGGDALIAAYATIRDQDHRTDLGPSPYRLQGLVATPIVIGRNVWIGTKATILRGCTIGDNCIIGANAVVTRDIDADTIAVGVPARAISRRAGEGRARTWALESD